MARQIAFLSLCLLICTACSLKGAETPSSIPIPQKPEPLKAPELVSKLTPTPKWIVSLSPAPASYIVSAEQICIEISDYPLWEPGDDATTLSTQLRENLKLSVDKTPMPVVKGQGFRSFGELTYMYDENGKMIGTNCCIISTCFDLKLSPGIHTATVSEKTRSGRSVTYTWDFKVDRWP